jgi:23S rRNA G2069 N7-methylase RlmK/C1962 C5-methylase RlmI
MLSLDSLPRPSAKRIALHVTPAAERALRSGHPWVFDQSIRSQSHAGQPGDLAVIFDARRRFLAIGLYDPRSPIRVRVLQHHAPAAIDRAWFTERLRAAANIRQPLLATGTDGYRLVHGENDGLPGLVVDRYAGTLVLKLYTAAWLPHLADILAGLADVQLASGNTLDSRTAVITGNDHETGVTSAQYAEQVAPAGGNTPDSRTAVITGDDHEAGVTSAQYAEQVAPAGGNTLDSRTAVITGDDHEAGVTSAQYAEQVAPAERVVLRYSRNLDALMAQHGLADGQLLSGPALGGPVIFQENGLRFAADVAHGHKTGFFFDQRENRALVRALSAGRTLPVSSAAVHATGGGGPAGRRVLDLFAYSGGFSVYAAAGGAASVTSVDVSAPALEAAAANLALNRDASHIDHKLVVADAFDYLEGFKTGGRRASGQKFDMVIVDPPSFAKSSAEIERALAAYARLARLATGLLARGGILVMASCSSRVTAANFFDTITQAAQQAGHPLTEIRRTRHALDHPITFAEGEYLKCLFASVAR